MDFLVPEPDYEYVYEDVHENEDDDEDQEEPRRDWESCKDWIL